MSVEAQIALAGLLMTLIGLMVAGIYNAGRLSVRVEMLEQWRTEMRADMNVIYTELRNLSKLIQGENV